MVSQFIEENFCEQGGIVPEFFGAGHGFDVDPSMEDAFLHELARAALMREIYPRNPVVFLSPKNVSTLFHVAGMITEQSILAVPEATSKLEELKFAAAIIKSCRTLGDEIQFSPNGKISRRANTILENAAAAFKKMEPAGLFASLNIDEKSGAGLEGVFQKERDYLNPVDELIQKKPQETYCLTEAEPIIKSEQETKPHKGRRHGRHRHHRKPAFKKPPQGSDQSG